MILYYGADKKIIEPEFGAGSPSNDYGVGFYMTPDYEMAKIWASKFENGGYAMKYEVNLNDSEILNIDGSDEESILKWAIILIKHRFDFTKLEKLAVEFVFLQKHFPISLDFCDFVIGFRADDSYFSYMNSFLENDLSVEALSKAMRLGKLGLQYVAISKKAHQKIKFISAERIEHSDKYEKLQKEIKNEYLKIKSEDKITNTFIRDIMRRYEKDVWF